MEKNNNSKSDQEVKPDREIKQSWFFFGVPDIITFDDKHPDWDVSQDEYYEQKSDDP